MILLGIVLSLLLFAPISEETEWIGWLALFCVILNMVL